MAVSTELTRSVRAQLEGTARAARRLRLATTKEKNAALQAMAVALDGGRKGLLEANRADVEAARQGGTRGTFLDRLELDDDRIDAMVTGLREVAAMEDPIGRMEDRHTRPNGLEVARMRIPLGVIAMVYEARPSVTADAAGLCLKSGNAVVLRGGSEALRSNRSIAKLLGAAIESAGLPGAVVTLLKEADRDAILVLIQQPDLVDLAIPRGGEGLIRFVAEHARVPVVQHYKGVCHVFVDASAELGAAQAIAVNAKLQRPGVCNAMECLLVHRDVAGAFLPRYADALGEDVALRCDERARELLAGRPNVTAATDDDWGHEFLDLILAVKVVDGLDEALEHVQRFGSNHTEAILTGDDAAAKRFVREVDASCVLVNASTRFNDGAQLGLGAEMGISTTKMHAYGPMGLEELTARKFVVLGSGQVRE